MTKSLPEALSNKDILLSLNYCYSPVYAARSWIVKTKYFILCILKYRFHKSIFKKHFFLKQVTFFISPDRGNIIWVK